MKYINVYYRAVSGWITSKYDGQSHYISAPTLIRLYGLTKENCINLMSPYLRHRILQDDMFCKVIDVHPRYDGNYKLPLT